MMETQEVAQVVARLQARLSMADLPAKAAAAGQSLVTRLSTPVRIGLFGLPGAGKRTCVNALIKEPVLEATLPLSTLEIIEGEHAQTHAVLADGATLAAQGYPSTDLMGLQPMFLQVQTPAEAIKGRAYLVVVADAEAADMVAALDWAASRVDVAIWCTRDWSTFEQSIWLKAPDTLTHHALLVGHDADGLWHEHGFQAAFPTSHSDARQGLSGYLNRMIEEALCEDIDAADVFLHRYGPPEAEVVPIRPEAPVPAPKALQSPVPKQARSIEPEARRALSRLFQTLRSEVLVLSETLEASDDVTALAALEDLFETLAFEAQEEMIEETWPELSAQICAARDLAVLMRLEGDGPQLEDSAQLLVQVRQDIELRLVA